MIDIVLFDEIYAGPVYELVKEFYDEHLTKFGLDLTYLDIEAFIETHGESTFIMLEDGAVIGVLGGVVSKQPMSDCRVYQETVWYVRKDRRQHGVKLLSFVEKWCQIEGIEQIIMAFMHTEQAEKMMSFFGRCGYKPLETHMIKTLKLGAAHA